MSVFLRPRSPPHFLFYFILNENIHIVQKAKNKHEEKTWCVTMSYLFSSLFSENSEICAIF